MGIQYLFHIHDCITAFAKRSQLTIIYLKEKKRSYFIRVTEKNGQNGVTQSYLHLRTLRSFMVELDCHNREKVCFFIAIVDF